MAYNLDSYRAPYWAKSGNFVRGRDPLGVQNSSISVYATLLPGMTNLTLRLRYYGMYLWLLDEYGKFTIDELSAQNLLDPTSSISDMAITKPGPDGYMRSDATEANELFKSRIFVRIKDFDVKSNIVAVELKEIDKGVWKEFLRLYTIIKLIK